MVDQSPGGVEDKKVIQYPQQSSNMLQCVLYTAQEMVWMCNVLHHVNLPQMEPTIMFCDNKSAIQLAKNLEFHKRTKHISVKYHYVRSCQKDAVISVQYVSTKDQLADLFTKPLNRPLFENLRNTISVCFTPGSATE